MNLTNFVIFIPSSRMDNAITLCSTV